MTDWAVAASNLSKVYDGNTAALRDVSCYIDQGEFVALTGRSGSGKSTLLNLIGLLDRPSSGTLSVAGTDTAGMSERKLTELRSRTIGFVFQAFHLLDRRSVLDNVRLGVVYLGVTRRDRYMRAHDLVDQLGLGHRAQAMPSALSGGERQRVAIARALMARPRILLCDEPTGNLDTANASIVLDLLADINATADTTVVVVTHDDDVAGRASRVVRLTDGVVESDTADRDGHRDSA